MLINIKTSEANKQIVQELTRKLSLGTENIIARISLAYSLSTNEFLDLNEVHDSKGKEYKDEILFGSHKNLYIALICQHYGLFKTDKDIPKYVKMHIDHGLGLIQKIFVNSKNYTGFDFIAEQIEKGIDSLKGLDTAPGHVANNNQIIAKDYYNKKITVKVGRQIGSDDEILISPNDISIYNNCHIAIAGGTGTGKTQFALELLRQISGQTGGKVNFIYLDFKGLRDDDLKYIKPFFDSTNAKLIDAPQTPFPVNPLTFIDNVNDKNKIMGINKFVDIISKYSNIGKNQGLILKDVIKELFHEKTDGEYPTLGEIYDRFLQTVGDKPSTLRDILESLSELDVFETTTDSRRSFLNENYYLSLSGDLPKSVRFTSLFLIINYIYNTFMNMSNTPVEDGIVGIRYVLLIDEAHVLFKEKKYQDILEKMLREIRSKGVSVVLLSQGIEEFNQPSFDFSTMCEIAFLLEIKDKTNIKNIKKFLGLGDNSTNSLARSMEKIAKGQAISNIKEYDYNKLFLIEQFVR